MLAYTQDILKLEKQFREISESKDAPNPQLVELLEKEINKRLDLETKLRARNDEVDNLRATIIKLKLKQPTEVKQAELIEEEQKLSSGTNW